MKSSASPATLSADMIRRAVEILKQPPSAPLDQVVVPRGLWEQIINRLETAASEIAQNTEAGCTASQQELRKTVGASTKAWSEMDGYERAAYNAGTEAACTPSARVCIGWIQELADGRKCFYEGEMDPREVHDNGKPCYPVFK